MTTSASKDTSKIESSPKGGIDTKAPEGEVTTTSVIKPKDSSIVEQGKVDQIDLTKAGQRKVNLIWEVTQAVIAIMVTTSVIYSVMSGIESLLLGNAFTLIIAIYFVRMNHVKTGGVGGTDDR